MQQISDSVFIETNLNSCNTGFVITKEGIVLIETPMVPSEAKKWAEEIAGYGQLRYVINTEPHYDHAYGNCWFGGTVVGHEGARQDLLAADVEGLIRILEDGAPDSLPLDSDFYVRPPTITFSQQLNLYLGDHTFQLISTPGHTAHQITVYIPEEKLLFTGDNVVEGVPILFQARPYEWLDSLHKIQQLDVTRIVPGHGEVCGKEALAEMSRKLNYWIETVRTAIGKGWSLQEANEKIPLLEDYPVDPNDERAFEMVRWGISRLYEVFENERSS
jgi:glyoxylase-like metal-dependent hydrolase (beta-lactamase superfamily II)